MKSNFEKIVDKRAGGTTCVEVLRVPHETFVLQFQSFAAEGNPVIYRIDSVLNSIDELTETIGGYPLRLRSQKFKNTDTYNPLNREYTESTVREFITSIGNGSSEAYAGNVMFDGNASEVFGVEMPEVVPASSLRKPSIWLGPAGCVTPLHRDSADNFAIHVCGAKRWTLFSPEQAPLLGIMSMEGLAATGGEFAISEINIDNPDLETFPQFNNAVPLQIDLHAGEVLFLPAGWHHHVRTLETSLMLNYWVEDAAYSPAFLKHDTNQANK